MTIWKPIPGLPERFEASDDGHVRTLPYECKFMWQGREIMRRNPGRVLKQQVRKAHPNSRLAHRFVGIYTGTGRDDNTKIDYRVANLVASAFCGLPYDRRNQAEVQQWRIRFRDGDQLNCHAMNLEWVHSAGENGSNGENQRAYEENLDAWRKHDPKSTLSRLFGDDYDEDAA